MPYDPTLTTEAFSGMVFRAGGGLVWHKKAGFYPLRSGKYITPVKYPDGYKPFEISLYNYEEDRRILTMRLIVNPRDIQIGQVWMANNTYTRAGWVTTLWGRQQSTISANGQSAAFYLANDGFRQAVNAAGEPAVNLQDQTVNEGLVNIRRKNSIGFINLQTLVAFFKNNGAYFMEDPKEQTIYKDGTNRVIYVVDSVLITYGGNEFLGSFNSFTLDEAGEDPYSIDYNFEYVISGIRGTPMEGHLRKRNRSTEEERWNTENSRVIIGLQGSNTKLVETLFMDKKEQNVDLGIDEGTISKYVQLSKENEYTKREEASEDKYWTRDKARTILEDTVVISSTNGEGTTERRPDHDKKIDFRPSTGVIRSMSKGVIVEVRTSDRRKGPNYLIIRSEYPVGSGKYVFARYYHLDTADLRNRNWQVGDTVEVGTPIGFEGTDNGAYPPHCDLEVKPAFDTYKTEYINQTFNSIPQSKREDALKFFGAGVDAMAAGMANEPQKGDPLYEYTKINFRHGSEKVQLTSNSKITVDVRE